MKKLALVLLVAVCVMGQTPTAKLKVTFTAPTTNTDGTPLTDLAGYRVYIRTEPIAVCPPSGTYKTATTAIPAPTPGTTVTRTYSGYAWNTRYYARVVAVDKAGNLSACSNEATTVTDQPVAPFLGPGT